jgi:chemotaxis protein MotB
MVAAMIRNAKLLLLGVVAAGCVSSGKYDGVVADLKKCQDERAAASSKVTELSKQVADLTLERDKASAHGSELEGSMSATQKELAELRKQHEEAEKRLAAFRALTARFQKMIDAGKIKVVFRNGQMIMKLPSGILFASGRADLSKDGQATLGEVASILKEFSDRKFLIAGHTDNVPLPRHGRFKDNWELSTARALTVARVLTQAGMNATSLVAAGVGEHDPILSNTSAANMARNRRIEIALLPAINELPPMPASLTEKK